MKKYIIPTTEIYQTSVNLMIGLNNTVGQGEFANTSEFDEESELDINKQQSLWDD